METNACAQQDEPSLARPTLSGWEACLGDYYQDVLDPRGVGNAWKWDRTKALTLAYFIHQLRAQEQQRRWGDDAGVPLFRVARDDDNVKAIFRVVVLGVNPEEEENALGSWGDVLGRVMPDERLEVLMIGPQVSAERHETSVEVAPHMWLSFYKGRFHDYRAELVDGKTYHDPDMFVAFHSGFHFYTESWTSTLVALLNDRVVCCFTSHDTADENKQWQWLTGCCDFETLIPPSSNPFRCDRKERKRAYNDRLFAIRGLPDSLYIFASLGPRRLEKEDA